MQEPAITSLFKFLIYKYKDRHNNMLLITIDEITFSDVLTLCNLAVVSAINKVQHTNISKFLGSKIIKPW